MKHRVGSVSAELREFILTRDQRCFLAKLYDDHVCHDVWGTEHASSDLERLTLEHVKDESMMGKRAPSDPSHLIALCGYANFMVPSKAERTAMRGYLRVVSNDCGHVDPIFGCYVCDQRAVPA